MVEFIIYKKSDYCPSCYRIFGSIGNMLDLSKLDDYYFTVLKRITQKWVVLFLVYGLTRAGNNKGGEFIPKCGRT